MNGADVRTGIVARYSPVLERYLQVGRAASRVISVSFPTDPDPVAESADALLDRLFEYLDGTEESFEDVPIAMTLSGGRRDVLETLRSVPYGRRVSVEQLTRMTPGLDPSADESTVTVALSENPTPILLPDHRVRDHVGATPEPVRQTLLDIER